MFQCSPFVKGLKTLKKKAVDCSTFREVELTGTILNVSVHKQIRKLKAFKVTYPVAGGVLSFVLDF